MKTNHFLENIQSIMVRVPVWLIGLMAVSILGIGVVSNLVYDRPDMKELTGNRSMAFHGGPVEKPLQQPRADEIVTIASAAAELTSVRMGEDDIVQISFWYRCIPSCPVVSLVVEDEQGELLLEPLVHHPLLETIDWSYMTDASGLTLYQQVPNYASIEEVLTQASDEVLVERMILASLTMNEADYQELESSNSLDEVRYVITAREPTSDYVGWHSYKDAWNVASLTEKEIDEVRVNLVQEEPVNSTVEVSNLRLE